jgi:hypothetical protein
MRTEEKSYFKGYKANHFGYGINSSIRWKTSKQMEIAALIISLVYLLKKEWKKQCLIMKKYCMIPS